MLAPLVSGAAAPFFHAQAVGVNDRFNFDSLGGMHVVLLLAGDLEHPLLQPALALAQQRRDVLDDKRAALFVVSCNPAAKAKMAPSLPGIRHFLDADSAVSIAYGAAEGDRYRPHWLLLDRQLRVIVAAPIAEGARVFDRLEQALAAIDDGLPAPVLVVPRVLAPETCRELIDVYERQGGQTSGFMREIDGVTRLVVDPKYKRRKDVTIDDDALIGRLRARVRTAIVPMIQRAFQFEATRIERYLVACYDSAEQGHFRAHRDNTTKGTAHRRFAVTINLNAEDYDGGELRFPEFGSRTWRAPTGGAVVFSCGLLHEATAVTRGRRYAFLPFLYDDAAAEIRAANRAFLADEPALTIG